MKIDDETQKTKIISKYDDKQIYKKRSKSLKNNLIRKYDFKDLSAKNKIINKIDFKKLCSINQRKSDILFIKKNDSFKFYNDYFNNNENKRKNIILSNDNRMTNNSDLNIKYIYNKRKTLNNIDKYKENNSTTLPELKNFKKDKTRKISAIINNKEMIFSKVLFQKK